MFAWQLPANIITKFSYMRSLIMKTEHIKQSLTCTGLLSSHTEFGMTKIRSTGNFQQRKSTKDQKFWASRHVIPFSSRVATPMKSRSRGFGLHIARWECVSSATDCWLLSVLFIQSVMVCCGLRFHAQITAFATKFCDADVCQRRTEVETVQHRHWWQNKRPNYLPLVSGLNSKVLVEI